MYRLLWIRRVVLISGRLDLDKGCFANLEIWVVIVLYVGRDLGRRVKILLCCVESNRWCNGTRGRFGLVLS